MGYADGTVERCFATGNVSGYNSVGGIAGYTRGTVKNCYATGNVSASIADGAGKFGYVGGVAGQLDGVTGESVGSIQNCYATGNVSLPNNFMNAGGVAGGYYGNSGQSVMNCVALSKEVRFYSSYSDLDDAAIGRILGGCGYNPVAITFTNNYARSNMGLLNSHIAVHDIIAI